MPHLRNGPLAPAWLSGAASASHARALAAQAAAQAHRNSATDGGRRAPCFGSASGPPRAVEAGGEDHAVDAMQPLCDAVRALAEALGASGVEGPAAEA
eukprot:CAMPEP_0170270534 /NCGR_PEP_ID=MMETSP0116_2-20130129/35212_1 /TAXON_ID=400756 /ORGANISM="Durinskia baltica, Strain CSIRO CS-38" /LENGTH=97 /DNA_ID=CAMNT_0010521727 /DNA_START=261 /DNA_END=551 /DNA_ORIENTATION=+